MEQKTKTGTKEKAWNKQKLFLIPTLNSEKPGGLVQFIDEERTEDLEAFGVFLMRTWYIVGAVLLVVFLIWGYMSGHCLLCKGVRNALGASSTAGTTPAT